MASKLARPWPTVSALLHRPQVAPHRLPAYCRVLTNIMSTISQPIFASDKGTRVKQIEASLQPLLESKGGKWKVTADSKGISRHIQFKTFRQASTFITQMIPKIAEVRHHPTWTNTYNSVEMTWSTHRDKESKLAGISELDVQMATTSDEMAEEYGEQTGK